MDTEFIDAHLCVWYFSGVSIPRRTILSILIRSLFIQAAWNFKGMQNIGFTHAILPGLRQVMPGRVDEGVRRYLSFFNTQPYMAPTIMGVNLHLHEQGNEEMIARLGPSLSGTLAALGDTFFWATLKPLLALLGLTCIFTDQLWGLFLVLVLYNTAHVWVMSWGFLQGYRHGANGAMALGRVLSIEVTRYVSLAIPFLSGAVLCLAAVWFGMDGFSPLASPCMPQGITGDIVIFLAFLAFVALIKLRVNLFWLVYGVFASTMLWTMLR